MNLLKNNNNLLKFSDTWTANSLLFWTTESGFKPNKTGTLELINIPTWLFDSPESVLIAEIPLDAFAWTDSRTKTINLTAKTGTTVVVTVTYSYNGNQLASGIRASLTATPATIQYETLIGFDQG